MKYLFLFLFSGCLFLSAGELKINSVNAGKPVISGSAWRIEKSFDLSLPSEKNQILALNSGNWKRHQTNSDIRGYNGDILIKIQAPGSVTTLKYAAEICNYADAVTRTLTAEYSSDGINFKKLASVNYAGGRGKTAGFVNIKDNKGLLFLRFKRIHKPNDANGRSGYVVFKKLAFSLAGKSGNIAKKRPLKLKEVFPTGVCWPWERTQLNAERAGMELWQFAEYTMKLLKDNGYNTAWFLHFNDDPLKLFALAQKYGFKVLLEGKTLSHFYHGFQDMSEIDASARTTAARFGHAPEMLGYILKDEPRNHDLGWVNYIYDRMRLADPEREPVFSVMNRQFPMYIRQSRAQVIMTDMYYFFAPRSINGPNIRKDSQKMLSNALQNAGLLAERHNKHYWFCGQIFQEYWGRCYRDGNKFIALPGGYHHWQMPTPSEVTWQAWESLRNGAKGLFFYVLYGPRTLETHPDKVTDPVQKKLVKRMDASSREAAGWKIQPLNEKTMILPPGEGMIDFDGKPTVQLLATGDVMHIIRKNEKLLLRLRKNDFPAFFSPDGEIAAETFRIPGSEKLWGIIVNNNCDNGKNVKLLLPANAVKIRDISRNTPMPELISKGAFKETSITLAPGSGALLELEFSSFKGLPFCDESFDNERSFAVVPGADAEVFTYGDAGYEMNRAIRIKSNKKSPAAVLKNLIHTHPVNAITRNLNAQKNDGIIYCLVEGNLESLEICSVKGKGSGRADNAAHLKEKNQRASGSTGTTVIHRGNMTVPVAVPQGTAHLEFHLARKTDHIDRIRLWFIPKEK